MIKPRATFFHSLISRLGKSHSSSFVPCQRGSKFLVFFRGHKLPPLYILPLSSWTLLESWSNRKLQSFHGHQSEVGRRERITRFLFRLIFCLWPTCDDHTRRNWRATNLCVCVRARHTRIDNFEEINSRGRNRTRSQVETWETIYKTGRDTLFKFLVGSFGWGEGLRGRRAVLTIYNEDLKVWRIKVIVEYSL